MRSYRKADLHRLSQKGGMPNFKFSDFKKQSNLVMFHVYSYLSPWPLYCQ